MRMRELFREWIDFDVAMYNLGVCLGMFEGSQEEWFELKGLFWTNNSINNALHMALFELVNCGYLLCDDEEQRFKINEEFDVEKI